MSIQQLSGAHRAGAEWINSGKARVCSVCHRSVQAREQVLRVAHHPGRNQPWSTHHVCAECAPGVSANLGAAYPGPPPAQ